METLLGTLEVLVDCAPDPNFEVEYSVSFDAIHYALVLITDDGRVAS